MRAPRRCSWCRSLDHRDRHDKTGRAVCPERQKFEADLEREERLNEIRRKAIEGKTCDTCGHEPASVKVLLSGGRSMWTGESCERLFELLSRALGGAPHREPLAVAHLRVVK